VKYEPRESTYTLSSGRRIYANRGIFGLCEEMRLHEGYDGAVYTDVGAGEWRDPTDDDAPLTKPERDEIAGFMVERWARWGDRKPWTRE
jgi:hypothetical protein